MARVIIPESLKNKIMKKFAGQSVEIFRLLNSLKDNPNKGKALGQVNGVLIKELKYKSFRFYFLVDGYLIKVIDISDLNNILIKFVAMSHKKDQQKTIDSIKNFLRTFGKDSLGV